MAATGPKGLCLPVAVALLLLASFGQTLFADRADDVRSQISYIATSLASGNATDAMVPFDKSYVNYDKLRGYFDGLTSFVVENEVDVTDEQDTDTDTKLTINWTLTLIDRSTNQTERRTGDIEVRFVLKNRKWKIVDLAPIEIFDPLQKRTPKR